MALGIAATTVVGSVAYGVLLKPLPWADAPRLVRLYENRQGGTGRFRPMMTNATYRQWYDHPSTLDALGAWSARTAVLSGTTDAQQLKVAGVTPGFFEMLGGRAAIGHLFGQGDEQVGRPSIAVVSYAMWQQQFGGRADIIGLTVRLDGTTHTIVGVMPASFNFPDRETRAWLPLLISPMAVPGQPGRRIQMFQLSRWRSSAATARSKSRRCRCSRRSSATSSRRF